MQKTTTIISPSASDQDWTRNASDQGVLFPAARRWGDLVAETQLIDDVTFMRSWQPSQPLGLMRFFCSFDRLRSPLSFHKTYFAEIELQPSILATLRDTGRHPFGEPTRYGMKAIEWPDGRTLVLAEISGILGSYWLGFVETASLPDTMTRQAPQKGWQE